MTRTQMIAAIKHLLNAGRPFAELVSLAEDYRDRFGSWVSVGDLLDGAGVKFGCSIVDTWNGGAGGRVSRFTSDLQGLEAWNECFEWILKHTPFSFTEATTNQGLEVEFFHA